MSERRWKRRERRIARALGTERIPVTGEWDVLVVLRLADWIDLPGTPVGDGEGQTAAEAGVEAVLTTTHTQQDAAR